MLTCRSEMTAQYELLTSLPSPCLQGRQDKDFSEVKGEDGQLKNFWEEDKQEIVKGKIMTTEMEQGQKGAMQDIRAFVSANAQWEIGLCTRSSSSASTGNHYLTIEDTPSSL